MKRFFLWQCLRFEDDALTLPAVHHHSHRRIKVQVTDASVFVHRRLVVQPLPIHRAFAGIGIHGEVTNLECREILKKMTALGGRYAKIVESGLDNDARAGNFVPLDGDTQPGIIRSPTANSDQQIGPILGSEQAVEVGDRLRDFLTSAALKALRIHDHRIIQILDASVAQNFVALAEQLAWVQVVERQILVIARKGEGADLQEAKIGALARALWEPNRELYLHGNAQGVFSGFYQ